MFFEAGLIYIPFKSSSKVPVVLHNLGDHDVTLQAKYIIAQACASQQVTPLEPDSCRNKPDNNNVKFNLNDSPISEQWKDHHHHQA